MNMKIPKRLFILITIGVCIVTVLNSKFGIRGILIGIVISIFIGLIDRLIFGKIEVDKK